MNFSLTSEQQLIKQTASDFAKEELMAGAVERDKNKIWPKDQISKMADLGFMGMMVDEKWGGNGLDTISYCIAMEEISKVDASAGVILSINNSLVCQIFLDWANEHQLKSYLTKLASGKWLGAFSLSEPQSGSDASNLRTFAEKSNGHYILNGIKNWVSNGISSDLVIVFALTTKGIGHKGVSAFCVEKGTPGLTTGKKEEKLGIRSSDTCELYFENCKVPVENLIQEEGSGFHIAMKTLDGGRIGTGAQAVGIAQTSLDRALEYSKERKQFGKPISSFGAIKSKLAQMATNIEASRLLVLRAAALKDNHQPYTKEAAMGKLFASQTAMDAARECVQIFGGYGYMQEYGVERLMRDAKITQIYEGTSEIQELVIARTILEE